MPKSVIASRSYAKSLLVPLTLLLFAFGQSLLVSPLPDRSWSKAWPTAIGIGALVVCSRLRWNDRHIGFIWHSWVIMGASIAMVGYLGMLAKQNVLFPFLRAVFQESRFLSGVQQKLPDTFHPNVVAGALELFLPFGAGLVVWHARQGGRRLVGVWGWGGVFLLTMTVLAIAQSRSAYLAVFAQGLLFWLLRRRSSSRWLVYMTLGGLALVVAAALTVELLGMVQFRDPFYGVSWRLDMWRIGLRTIGDFPLTGVGFGCFRPVAQLMYPIRLNGTSEHVHNLYMQIAIDMGVLGLISFVWLLAIAVRRCGSYSDRVAGTQRWLFAQCAVVALVGTCLHGVFDAAIWGNKAGFALWVVLGFALMRSRPEHWPGNT